MTSRKRAFKTLWKGDQIVRWVLNTASRRIPNFVQDITGCKTKKSLLQRFGPNVVFERAKDGSFRIYHAWDSSLIYDAKRGRQDRWPPPEPPTTPAGKIAKNRRPVPATASGLTVKLCKTEKKDP